MLPTAISAIAFDAVGTLIYPDPSAAEVYAEVGRRHGSMRPVDAIACRFAAAFASEEESDRLARLQTSEEREVERWRHIVGTVLDDVADRETCFQELYEYFSRPAAWSCTAEAAGTLATLHARGYLLALASNYDRRLRKVVAGLEPLRFVQHLVISSEVGWRKPSEHFFAATGTVLSLPLQQVLFVGDDPVNDYAGAQAVGMQALLFDPRPRGSHLGLARLTNLKDLLDHLPEVKKR